MLQEGAPPLERFLLRIKPPPRSVSSLRYRGDDQAVSLSTMTERDRAAARALYATLVALDATLRSMSDEDDPGALAQSFDLDGTLALARSLGSGADPIPNRLRPALHDVRGGALTSLLIEMQRARLRRGPRGARSLKVLVAAHLKVMRNALLELDDVRRGADLETSPHSIERLADALARVTGEGARGEGEIAVRVHRTFEGDITTSCMELGALDRAALNVVNNAIRHSAASPVDVALFSAGRAAGGDLCICVANAITEAHARALRDRFGEQLGRIWIEPFSTTGSGVGLKICVDIVSAAYGLAFSEEAVRIGLVGAEVEESCFYAWLHWPAVV